jgi:hypothetical protein
LDKESQSPLNNIKVSTSGATKETQSEKRSWDDYEVKFKTNFPDIIENMFNANNEFNNEETLTNTKTCDSRNRCDKRGIKIKCL